MSPSPYSDGPPLPPEAQEEDQPKAPPVPPSILAQQGAQAGAPPNGGPPSGGAPGGPGAPGGGTADTLQKQTLAMALQKLLEFKNSIEGLVTTMKAVDPESVALFIPAIEVGKAIESRLQQTMQRASNPSPSMAGMMGGAGPQQRPTSAAGL